MVEASEKGGCMWSGRVWWMAVNLYDSK